MNDLLYALVDGGWSVWGEWEACNGASLTRIRKRTCDNPIATGGGASCSGDSQESGTCTGKQL